MKSRRRDYGSNYACKGLDGSTQEILTDMGGLEVGDSLRIHFSGHHNINDLRRKVADVHSALPDPRLFAREATEGQERKYKHTINEKNLTYRITRTS